MRPEKNGNIWEQRAESSFCEHAYIKCGRDLFRDRDLMPEGKYYARHVPVGATRIGGSSTREVDIYLHNRPIFLNGCCLEVKWQQSGGSTLRKLDSAVIDAKATFRIKGSPTALIYGGPAFTTDLITYLKKQVGDGLLAVWSMDEFQAAVNYGFLETGIIKVIRPPKKEKPCNPFYESGGLWDEDAS